MRRRPRRSQSTPPPQPAPSSALDHRSTAERAADVVRAYYRLVNAGAYRQAWQLFAPATQATSGGFSTWKDGYRFTRSTAPDPELAPISSGKPATNEFAISLHAVAVDACGQTIRQAYSGTWTVEPSQRSDYALRRSRPTRRAAEAPSRTSRRVRLTRAVSRRLPQPAIPTTREPASIPMPRITTAPMVVATAPTTSGRSRSSGWITTTWTRTETGKLASHIDSALDSPQGRTWIPAAISSRLTSPTVYLP